jgi:hypothetical protein
MTSKDEILNDVIEDLQYFDMLDNATRTACIVQVLERLANYPPPATMYEKYTIESVTNLLHLANHSPKDYQTPTVKSAVLFIHAMITD